MPDRLRDAMANSEPKRHMLYCMQCFIAIKGSTALGVRFAMRSHRKHSCRSRPKK